MKTPRQQFEEEHGPLTYQSWLEQRVMRMQEKIDCALRVRPPLISETQNGDFCRGYYMGLVDVRACLIEFMMEDR